MVKQRKLHGRRHCHRAAVVGIFGTHGPIIRFYIGRVLLVIAVVFVVINTAARTLFTRGQYASVRLDLCTA